METKKKMGNKENRITKVLENRELSYLNYFGSETDCNNR